MDSKFYSSLEKSISKSRLSTYGDSTSKEIDRIKNYILNAKISENFYFLLQNLEVSLRNAIYESFKLHYGDKKDFFFLYETDSRQRYKGRKEKHSRECWKMICSAKYNIINSSSTISDGKIIAELNFGFWTKLLASTDSKYTNMWRKIFGDVFPHYTITQSVDHDKILIGQEIDKIRDLRNRMFHYEPIFNKNIEQIHKDIIIIIGWINKDMQWLSITFDEFKNLQEKINYINERLA
jgi:hypothetical protein